MAVADYPANKIDEMKKNSKELGPWDLIRMAGEIKSSYQGLSEEFKDRLDDIATILSSRF